MISQVEVGTCSSMVQMETSPAEEVTYNSKLVVILLVEAVTCNSKLVAVGTCNGKLVWEEVMTCDGHACGTPCMASWEQKLMTWT